MKYFLLQFGPCLSWVCIYFNVVIERIATLHKNKIVFLKGTPYKQHSRVKKTPKQFLSTDTIGLSYKIDSRPYVFYDTIYMNDISQ